MKFLLMTFAAVLMLFMLSACGTITGVGKDLQSVGRGVQTTAEWCTPD